MSVTGPRVQPETRDLSAATRAEIERVRESGALGRSGRLLELFDYLAARSADQEPPKEVEIALDVFGKASADAVKDDPVARVYIHRLRRRLEDFYLREGVAHGVQLELPKGEYRIRGRPAGAAEEPAAASPPPRLRLAALWPLRWRLAAAALAALLVVGNVAAWAIFVAGRDADVRDVRRDPVWADLVDDDRPLMIVVGDYYMYGEYEGGMFLNRLVRDFAINSREDLLASLRSRPEEDAAYAEVDVKYLPISTAYAVTRVMRVLPEDREVRVTLASELSPEMLRDFDVIYVGLVSGLGALREPAFAASRFSVGSSYDEIVDGATGERYVSEAFLLAPYDGMYHDYGLAARFPGPGGNEVLILAGARDAAVIGVADSLTRPAALRALHDAAGKGGAVEALYRVLGQRHTSLESTLLAAATRDGAAAWSTLDAAQFPSE